ncbi:MAG: hypothetical protein ACI9OU_002749 [Candidatus Promineifilaceae bacterium]|jgi:hypothetical protein
MITATIKMKLDADTAGIFSEATEEDQGKLCVLWGVLLHEYQAAPVPLLKLMDQIGSNAKVRGLTPEKLGLILDAE